MLEETGPAEEEGDVERLGEPPDRYAHEHIFIHDHLEEGPEVVESPAGGGLQVAVEIPPLPLGVRMAPVFLRESYSLDRVGRSELVAAKTETVPEPMPETRGLRSVLVASVTRHLQ